MHKMMSPILSEIWSNGKGGFFVGAIGDRGETVSPRYEVFAFGTNGFHSPQMLCDDLDRAKGVLTEGIANVEKQNDPHHPGRVENNSTD